MLDLRQHLFYFIAIFLMLGVGILVGASFYGPVQVRQQQTSLAHLRAEVDGAVQDGRDAKAQLAKTDAAIESLRPALVRNKLTGRRIVLLQTGDYSDAVQSAAAALRDASANPAATVTLTDRWNALDPPTRAADLAAFTRALVLGTSDPARATGLQDLEDAGLVVLTGTLDAPTTNFVMVGGSHEGSTGDAPFIANLVRSLQAQIGPEAALAGCEPYAADVSDMPAFQQAGISTVDCIDRPLGQLALPFALRGGPDAGDYGLKPTAALQVPPSLAGATP